MWEQRPGCGGRSPASARDGRFRCPYTCPMTNSGLIVFLPLVGAILGGIVGAVGGAWANSWYRDREAKKIEDREFEGLLHLLDLEMGANQAALATFEEDPATMTHSPAKLRTEAWDSARVRIVQLLQDKEEFRKIATYYHNIQLADDVIVFDPATDLEKWKAILDMVGPLQDQGRDARAIIHKYIPAAEEQFGYQPGMRKNRNGPFSGIQEIVYSPATVGATDSPSIRAQFATLLLRQRQPTSPRRRCRSWRRLPGRRRSLRGRL